jgi:Holliday junction DNA helicase RuvA
VIALLSGNVAVRRGDHVVIECGGVGYRVAVSAQTLRKIPAVGHQTLLHTHMVVRDDALALYGFATEEERSLFLMLLGVQSVGPKVALAVLSGGPPRDLLAAVAGGDTARLQAVPGNRRRAAREGRRRAAGRGDHDHPNRRPALACPRGADRPRLQPR